MFQHNEFERLSDLITEWLDAEQRREDFEVIAREESRSIDIGGITLRIRLDRLDRVNGNLCVLDYKTSQQSARGLEELPLREAQLPLYAISDPDIRGTLYGIVRDRPRLVGVVAQDLPFSSRQIVNLEWSNAATQWRYELERLANNFKEGFAEPTPDRTTCAHCHLKSLCRVSAA